MAAQSILIIEDDIQFRNFIEEVLDDEGYTIFTADDGQQGIDLVEEQEPDLILTDLLMPEKDGVRVISEVKCKFPQIPIIAMSGGQSVFSPVFLEAAATLGAMKTLNKPFKDEELLEAIKSCINSD